MWDRVTGRAVRHQSRPGRERRRPVGRQGIDHGRDPRPAQPEPGCSRDHRQTVHPAHHQPHAPAVQPRLRRAPAQPDDPRHDLVDGSGPTSSALRPITFRTSLETGATIIPAIARYPIHSINAAARPLIAQPGASERELSRTFQVFDHAERDRRGGPVDHRGRQDVHGARDGREDGRRRREDARLGRPVPYARGTTRVIPPLLRQDEVIHPGGVRRQIQRRSAWLSRDRNGW